ncbi:MAG: exo-beta-N-acetylmuramidase NamZ domain-containing protein, partial [Myxococcota bacterium]
VAPLARSVVRQIDGAVAAAIRDGETPGAVVAVVRPGGIAWKGAYGDRQRRPARAPMAVTDRFDLASLTKPIVAAAALRLAEAGRLDLDATVATYRPSFAREHKPSVTVAQLIAHTAGLPPANALRDYRGGRAEALARIDALPLRGVGRRTYSDVGYIVLGDVVARAAGSPLADALRTWALDPLGMGGARYGPVADAVPTERRGATWLRGVVHDPRAAALEGVAGHAGLFGRVDDLAAFVRMLLRRGLGPEDRFWSGATYARAVAPRPDGATLSFSRPRGGIGHTGFTGTMFWVEPTGRLGVVLLTSRLHPDGRGDVTSLRQQLRRIVADAAGPTVRTGADQWADAIGAGTPPPMAKGSLGIVTNHTGRTHDGRRLIDVLHRARGVRLHRIFTPEHGLGGGVEGHVTDGRDAVTGRPIVSLYGARNRPQPEQLRGIDTLVFDIQDVGVRFYTYITTLGYVLETAAAHDLRVVVLDRPNPLGLTRVDGPVLDDGLRSFIGYHALPVQYGMTVGELAGLFVAERGLDVDLHVVPVEGYRGGAWPTTGLEWRPPSPNLPSWEATLLYPALGLVEATNVSVGRGTDAPFSQLGAPWLDAEALAVALRAEAPAGVRFSPTSFTPTRRRFAGQRCAGLRFEVTDPYALRPVRLGLALARALQQQSKGPSGWRAVPLRRHLGDEKTYRGLVGGRDLHAMLEGWREDHDAFVRRRRPFLRYPR